MKNRMTGGWFRKAAAGAALSLAVAASALGSTAAVGSPQSDNAPAFAQVSSLAQTMAQSLQSGSWLSLDADRHALAEAVAPFTDVEAWQLEDAWAVADPRRQTVVYTALAQLGHPYVTNGESPDVGFDCSGLTKFAWAPVGVTLEHQSEAQAGEGQSRSFASALPGDLLHYPGHIGLFLGAGRAIMHAVNHETGLAVGIANDRMTHVIAPIA
jgi:cell wall-associated NlpC family hydrolase